MRNSLTGKVGFSCAVISAILGLGYFISQILWAHYLIPHVNRLLWLIIPPLALAPLFPLTMLCLNFLVPQKLKIWSNVGLGLSTLYCSIIGIVYSSEFERVVISSSQGLTDKFYLFMTGSESNLLIVNCVGYFFVSLSLFFTAFGFNYQSHKWIYISLMTNGLMMPILLIAIIFPMLSFVPVIWMLSFSWAMANLAIYFLETFQRFQPK